MTALEKNLFSLQQKLEHLNTEIATLIALTSAKQPGASESASVNSGQPITSLAVDFAKKSNVGINRYRQLANEHTGPEIRQ